MVNAAGLELLTFCNLNSATICTTWFCKKDEYKQSWQHPKTKQWHCIDYVIVRQRDRKRCLNCRVVRHADCGSGHRLLCLSFQLTGLRLYCRATSNQRRFDISRLMVSCDMTKEQRKQVEKCVEAYQQSVSASLDEDWKSDRSAGNEMVSCKEVFGVCRSQSLGCVSSSSARLVCCQ